MLVKEGWTLVAYRRLSSSCVSAVPLFLEQRHSPSQVLHPAAPWVHIPYMVTVLPPYINTWVLLAASERQTAPSSHALGMMDNISPPRKRWRMITLSLDVPGPDLLWHKVPKASVSLPTKLHWWLQGGCILTLPRAQGPEAATHN